MPRAAVSPFVRIAQPAPGVWELWWEDFRTDGTADYDDLVVRVEALSATP